MLGLSKNFTLPSSLLAFTTLGFFALAANAFVPQAGQVFRFQPNVLKSEKPFISKGTLSVAGSALPYTLKWYGPGNYEVSIANVGKAFTTRELSAPVTWTLVRQKDRCALKTFLLTVSCPPAALWGNLELSAQSDAVAKSLLAAGIYSAADLAWTETDSRQATPATQKSKVKLAIGENGKNPVAVLEIRGEEFKNDDPALARPMIQFDQTFLAPVLLRYEIDGSIVTIRATSDLEVRRNRTRFTPVLSEKIDIFEGGIKKGTLTRKEPETLASSASASKIPSTATGVDALKEELSAQGMELFRALLATH